MKQTTQSDINSAFSQVRHSIQNLIEFTCEDDRDDILYAANKLIKVLRYVHDNHQSWNDNAIREFVIIENDPLRYINVKSDQFNRMVRKIQEEMIVHFSIH